MSDKPAGLLGHVLFPTVKFNRLIPESFTKRGFYCVI
jgi:hypothetical protein